MTVEQAERQNFTVALDVPTWKRLKMQAAEERRPMIALVRDSIRNYLDLHSKR
jgi:hypothetical protein